LDSLITAAARALAAGDPLGALKLVALRDDPPALALRGIAMAQLGDFARAKRLLRSAARGFGTKEPLSKARCIVAEAEVAFASRELRWNEGALNTARQLLEKQGDHANAAHARYLAVRRSLLMGRMEEAERGLTQLPASLPPALRVTHELIVAGIAIRRLRTEPARKALARAMRAARAANIPALTAEVDSASLLLATPAARLIARGEERPLLLEQVEALFKSRALIVDACRYIVRWQGKAISLATRPVLFTLARLLAQSWPGDVARDVLVARTFRLKLADESHRARLRVEIGRLRKVLKSVADVSATPEGFVLKPRAHDVVVLTSPIEAEHAEVLALLVDGESWSSSALGLALGTSQRSVQRALDELAAAGAVQSFGRGRARRWMTPPMPGFTTSLLLPATLPVD
jgi:tetratricopeptide (TPR) repeat protein